ncbi:cobalt-precorrin-5B (C(1))-methyltransferase [Methylobrevis albus]|uniref:Cobalt-precorrin-5B C(1)-methyltransferase n=1 Tax=Methylobrevis albus TaxID=2793297 RepID=A0A931HZK7_9HYPH|nr:cobalt-precorrin-5B (C(1))-methyltransferase [Methylobrevis albus]MBH0236600.1 cobalt-precorrin-5B (C(1))-methyltransferase [Methylobrevis albus]
MSDESPVPEDDGRPALRRGWTTGACATAATRAACEVLAGRPAPAEVVITLPGGQTPMFAIARCDLRDDGVEAAVIKDAGDDPDVTHGALVVARLRPAPPGSGIVFAAGPGVGMVTRPGLPIPPGEPAINPVPRQMMRAAIAEAFPGVAVDLVVEIGIENGAKLAERTLNGRLGIVGGLSILGTTGIVIPFSCAAWIHSIHRGIDVARAMGIDHIAGSTGSTSEAAIGALDRLPETALIEMGDFVGGMLKYLNRHPVPRVTIAGGFAKMTKLAQGLLDLHSARGGVDLDWLADRLAEAGAAPDVVIRSRRANSALEVLGLAETAGISIAAIVARTAEKRASAALGRPDCHLDVAVFDRSGQLLARTD